MIVQGLGLAGHDGRSTRESGSSRSTSEYLNQKRPWLM